MKNRADLKVNIGGIELKNPVMTASGTFGEVNSGCNCEHSGVKRRFNPLFFEKCFPLKAGFKFKGNPAG